MQLFHNLFRLLMHLRLLLLSCLGRRFITLKNADKLAAEFLFLFNYWGWCLLLETTHSHSDLHWQTIFE